MKADDRLQSGQSIYLILTAYQTSATIWILGLSIGVCENIGLKLTLGILRGPSEGSRAAAFVVGGASSGPWTCWFVRSVPKMREVEVDRPV